MPAQACSDQLLCWAALDHCNSALIQRRPNDRSNGTSTELASNALHHVLDQRAARSAALSRPSSDASRSSELATSLAALSIAHGIAALSQGFKPDSPPTALLEAARELLAMADDADLHPDSAAAAAARAAVMSLPVFTGNTAVLVRLARDRALLQLRGALGAPGVLDVIRACPLCVIRILGNAQDDEEPDEASCCEEVGRLISRCSSILSGWSAAALDTRGHAAASGLIGSPLVQGPEWHGPYGAACAACCMARLLPSGVLCSGLAAGLPLAAAAEGVTQALAGVSTETAVDSFMQARSAVDAPSAYGSACLRDCVSLALELRASLFTCWAALAATRQAIAVLPLLSSPLLETLPGDLLRELGEGVVAAAQADFEVCAGMVAWPGHGPDGADTLTSLTAGSALGLPPPTSAPGALAFAPCGLAASLAALRQGLPPGVKPVRIDTTIVEELMVSCAMCLVPPSGWRRLSWLLPGNLRLPSGLVELSDAEAVAAALLASSTTASRIVVGLGSQEVAETGVGGTAAAVGVEERLRLAEQEQEDQRLRALDWAVALVQRAGEDVEPVVLAWGTAVTARAGGDGPDSAAPRVGGASGGQVPAGAVSDGRLAAARRLSSEPDQPLDRATSTPIAASSSAMTRVAKASGSSRIAKTVSFRFRPKAVAVAGSPATGMPATPTPAACSSPATPRSTGVQGADLEASNRSAGGAGSGPSMRLHLLTGSAARTGSTAEPEGPCASRPRVALLRGRSALMGALRSAMMPVGWPSASLVPVVLLKGVMGAATRDVWLATLSAVLGLECEAAATGFAATRTRDALEGAMEEAVAGIETLVARSAHILATGSMQAPSPGADSAERRGEAASRQRMGRASSLLQLVLLRGRRGRKPAGVGQEGADQGRAGAGRSAVAASEVVAAAALMAEVENCRSRADSAGRLALQCGSREAARRGLAAATTLWTWLASHAKDVDLSAVATEAALSASSAVAEAPAALRLAEVRTAQSLTRFACSVAANLLATLAAGDPSRAGVGSTVDAFESAVVSAGTVGDSGRTMALPAASLHGFSRLSELLCSWSVSGLGQRGGAGMGSASLGDLSQRLLALVIRASMDAVDAAGSAADTTIGLGVTVAADSGVSREEAQLATAMTEVLPTMHCVCLLLPSLAQSLGATAAEVVGVGGVTPGAGRRLCVGLGDASAVKAVSASPLRSRRRFWAAMTLLRLGEPVAALGVGGPGRASLVQPGEAQAALNAIATCSAPLLPNNGGVLEWAWALGASDGGAGSTAPAPGIDAGLPGPLDVDAIIGTSPIRGMRSARTHPLVAAALDAVSRCLGAAPSDATDGAVAAKAALLELPTPLALWFASVANLELRRARAGCFWPALAYIAAAWPGDRGLVPAFSAAEATSSGASLDAVPWMPAMTTLLGLVCDRACALFIATVARQLASSPDPALASNSAGRAARAAVRLHVGRLLAAAAHRAPTVRIAAARALSALTMAFPGLTLHDTATNAALFELVGALMHRAHAATGAGSDLNSAAAAPATAWGAAAGVRAGPASSPSLASATSRATLSSPVSGMSTSISRASSRHFLGPALSSGVSSPVAMTSGRSTSASSLLGELTGPAAAAPAATASAGAQGSAADGSSQPVPGGPLPVTLLPGPVDSPAGGEAAAGVLHDVASFAATWISASVQAGVCGAQSTHSVVARLSRAAAPHACHGQSALASGLSVARHALSLARGFGAAPLLPLHAHLRHGAGKVALPTSLARPIGSVKRLSRAVGSAAADQEQAAMRWIGENGGGAGAGALAVPSTAVHAAGVAAAGLQGSVMEAAALTAIRAAALARHAWISSSGHRGASQALSTSSTSTGFAAVSSANRAASAAAAALIAVGGSAASPAHGVNVAVGSALSGITAAMAGRGAVGYGALAAALPLESGIACLHCGEWFFSRSYGVAAGPSAREGGRLQALLAARAGLQSMHWEQAVVLALRWRAVAMRRARLAEQAVVRARAGSATAVAASDAKAGEGGSTRGTSGVDPQHGAAGRGVRGDSAPGQPASGPGTLDAAVAGAGQVPSAAWHAAGAIPDRLLSDAQLAALMEAPLPSTAVNAVSRGSTPSLKQAAATAAADTSRILVWAAMDASLASDHPVSGAPAGGFAGDGVLAPPEQVALHSAAARSSGRASRGALAYARSVASASGALQMALAEHAALAALLPSAASSPLSRVTLSKDVPVPASDLTGPAASEAARLALVPSSATAMVLSSLARTAEPPRSADRGWDSLAMPRPSSIGLAGSLPPALLACALADEPDLFATESEALAGSGGGSGSGATGGGGHGRVSLAATPTTPLIRAPSFESTPDAAHWPPQASFGPGTDYLASPPRTQRPAAAAEDGVEGLRYPLPQETDIEQHHHAARRRSRPGGAVSASVRASQRSGDESSSARVAHSHQSQEGAFSVASAVFADDVTSVDSFGTPPQLRGSGGGDGRQLAYDHRHRPDGSDSASVRSVSTTRTRGGASGGASLPSQLAMARPDVLAVLEQAEAVAAVAHASDPGWVERRALALGAATEAAAEFGTDASARDVAAAGSLLHHGRLGAGKLDRQTARAEDVDASVASVGTGDSQDGVRHVVPLQLVPSLPLDSADDDERVQWQGSDASGSCAHADHAVATASEHSDDDGDVDEDDFGAAGRRTEDDEESLDVPNQFIAWAMVSVLLHRRVRARRAERASRADADGARALLKLAASTLAASWDRDSDDVAAEATLALVPGAGLGSQRMLHMLPALRRAVAASAMGVVVAESSARGVCAGVSGAAAAHLRALRIVATARRTLVREQVLPRRRVGRSSSASTAMMYLVHAAMLASDAVVAASRRSTWAAAHAASGRDTPLFQSQPLTLAAFAATRVLPRLVPDAVRMLAWLPFRRCGEQTHEAAVNSWEWVASSADALSAAALVREVAAALSWSSRAGTGLFEGARGRDIAKQRVLAGVRAESGIGSAAGAPSQGEHSRRRADALGGFSGLDLLAPPVSSALEAAWGSGAAELGAMEGVLEVCNAAGGAGGPGPWGGSAWAPAHAAGGDQRLLAMHGDGIAFLRRRLADATSRTSRSSLATLAAVAAAASAMLQAVRRSRVSRRPIARAARAQLTMLLLESAAATRSAATLRAQFLASEASVAVSAAHDWDAAGFVPSFAARPRHSADAKPFASRWYSHGTMLPPSSSPSRLNASEAASVWQSATTEADTPASTAVGVEVAEAASGAAADPTHGEVGMQSNAREIGTAAAFDAACGADISPSVDESSALGTHAAPELSWLDACFEGMPPSVGLAGTAELASYIQPRPDALEAAAACVELAALCDDSSDSDPSSGPKWWECEVGSAEVRRTFGHVSVGVQLARDAGMDALRRAATAGEDCLEQAHQNARAGSRAAEHAGAAVAAAARISSAWDGTLPAHCLEQAALAPIAALAAITRGTLLSASGRAVPVKAREIPPFGGRLSGLAGSDVAANRPAVSPQNGTASLFRDVHLDAANAASQGSSQAWGLAELQHRATAHGSAADSSFRAGGTSVPGVGGDVATGGRLIGRQSSVESTGIGGIQSRGASALSSGDQSRGSLARTPTDRLAQGAPGGGVLTPLIGASSRFDSDPGAFGVAGSAAHAADAVLANLAAAAAAVRMASALASAAVDAAAGKRWPMAVARARGGVAVARLLGLRPLQPPGVEMRGGEGSARHGVEQWVGDVGAWVESLAAAAAASGCSDLDWLRSTDSDGRFATRAEGANDDGDSAPLPEEAFAAAARAVESAAAACMAASSAHALMTATGQTPFDATAAGPSDSRLALVAVAAVLASALKPSRSVSRSETARVRAVDTVIAGGGVPSVAITLLERAEAVARAGALAEDAARQLCASTPIVPSDASAEAAVRAEAGTTDVSPLGVVVRGVLLSVAPSHLAVDYAAALAALRAPCSVWAACSGSSGEQSPRASGVCAVAMAPAPPSCRPASCLAATLASSLDVVRSSAALAVLWAEESDRIAAWHNPCGMSERALPGAGSTGSAAPWTSLREAASIAGALSGHDVPATTSAASSVAAYGAIAAAAATSAAASSTAEARATDAARFGLMRVLSESAGGVGSAGSASAWTASVAGPSAPRGLAHSEWSSVARSVWDALGPAAAMSLTSNRLLGIRPAVAAIAARAAAAPRAVSASPYATALLFNLGEGPQGSVCCANALCSALPPVAVLRSAVRSGGLDTSRVPALFPELAPLHLQQGLGDGSAATHDSGVPVPAATGNGDAAAAGGGAGARYSTASGGGGSHTGGGDQGGGGGGEPSPAAAAAIEASAGRFSLTDAVVAQTLVRPSVEAAIEAARGITEGESTEVVRALVAFTSERHLLWPEIPHDGDAETVEAEEGDGPLVSAAAAVGAVCAAALAALGSTAGRSGWTASLITAFGLQHRPAALDFSRRGAAVAASLLSRAAAGRAAHWSTAQWLGGGLSSAAPLPAVLGVWTRSTPSHEAAVPLGACASLSAGLSSALAALGPEVVGFALPQLVQALRHDKRGRIGAALMVTGAHSTAVAHRLLWLLDAEGKQPSSSFAPKASASSAAIAAAAAAASSAAASPPATAPVLASSAHSSSDHSGVSAGDGMRLDGIPAAGSGGASALARSKADAAAASAAALSAAASTGSAAGGKHAVVVTLDQASVAKAAAASAAAEKAQQQHSAAAEASGALALEHGFQGTVPGPDSLPGSARLLSGRIQRGMGSASRSLFELQYSVFDALTDISRRLKREKRTKPARKAHIVKCITDVFESAVKERLSLARRRARVLGRQFVVIHSAAAAALNLGGSRLDAFKAMSAAAAAFAADMPLEGHASGRSGALAWAWVLLPADRRLRASKAVQRAALGVVSDVARSAHAEAAALLQEAVSASELRSGSVASGSVAGDSPATHCSVSGVLISRRALRSILTAEVLHLASVGGGRAIEPAGPPGVDFDPVVFLPTSPQTRIISVDISSGRPMQSAAKCPFLLKFATTPFAGPDSISVFDSAPTSSVANSDDRSPLLPGESETPALMPAIEDGTAALSRQLRSPGVRVTRVHAAIALAIAAGGELAAPEASHNGAADAVDESGAASGAGSRAGALGPKAVVEYTALGATAFSSVGLLEGDARWADAICETLAELEDDALSAEDVPGAGHRRGEDGSGGAEWGSDDTSGLGPSRLGALSARGTMLSQSLRVQRGRAEQAVARAGRSVVHSMAKGARAVAETMTLVTRSVRQAGRGRGKREGSLADREDAAGEEAADTIEEDDDGKHDEAIQQGSSEEDGEEAVEDGTSAGSATGNRAGTRPATPKSWLSDVDSGLGLEHEAEEDAGGTRGEGVAARAARGVDGEGESGPAFGAAADPEDEDEGVDAGAASAERQGLEQFVAAASRADVGGEDGEQPAEQPAEQQKQDGAASGPEAERTVAMRRRQSKRRGGGGNVFDRMSRALQGIRRRGAGQKTKEGRRGDPVAGSRSLGGSGEDVEGQDEDEGDEDTEDTSDGEGVGPRDRMSRRTGLDEVENAVGVQQVGEQAVIFKVFDDCRQDALALQVIKLLDWSFQRLGIGLFLKPYEVLPSRVGREAAEGGMLEVVPDVISLDEMGRGLGIPSIYHLFRTRYGRPDEARFERARWNLQRSMAAYAVACYTLWIKDRHDGNIMVDGEGHLVHIDFGFLLGISPGGNLGFETAAFKITPQMINVLGGSDEAEPYLRFLEMSARAYMQARQQRTLLEALVCTTADSGLPCFHFGHTLSEFRARLRPEADADTAAAHWRARVRDARSTSTTALYDGIQRMQNGIHSEAFQ